MICSPPEKEAVSSSNLREHRHTAVSGQQQMELYEIFMIIITMKFLRQNRYRCLRLHDVPTILSRCDEGTMNITRPRKNCNGLMSLGWVKFYVVMTKKKFLILFYIGKLFLSTLLQPAQGLSFDSFLRKEKEVIEKVESIEKFCLLACGLS